MQVLGLIRRNFVLNDKEDFLLLFNGFVRPHLEYCVSVWSPYLRKDIECSCNGTLAMLYSEFTAYIFGIHAPLRKVYRAK